MARNLCAARGSGKRGVVEMNALPGKLRLNYSLFPAIDYAVNRRKFIRITAKTVAGSCLAGGLYAAVEAKYLETTRVSLPVPNLPPAFHGKTIAFLSDIHHSFVVPRSYIDHAVGVANSLSPDIVILGGDYVTSGAKYRWLDGRRYIEPCFESLKNLEAKMGRFAVTGNHDNNVGLREITAAMSAAGLRNIDNSGVWIEENGQRLRICGVADLRTNTPDVKQALAGATNRDAVILVSHNPDVAGKKIEDDRVGLMLAGHTHGGQVVLPFIGAPFVNLCSDYGQKYRYGLVQGPKCKVFVTCGVGTLPPAFRLNCPPEVVLITLTSPAA
jgi:predicted MPP superfamily phosphohydrolase